MVNGYTFIITEYQLKIRNACLTYKYLSCAWHRPNEPHISILVTNVLIDFIFYSLNRKIENIKVIIKFTCLIYKLWR